MTDEETYRRDLDREQVAHARRSHDERRRDLWRESSGLPIAAVLRAEGTDGVPTIAGKHLARGVHTLMAQAANADREREGVTEHE